MKNNIGSALMDRLAAVHRAETERRRAAAAAGDSWSNEAIESLEELLQPIREAILAHCPSVRFLQEADTRIARVGPGDIMWTWAVPVGPDCWGGEPELRPAFGVAAHAEIGVKMLSDMISSRADGKHTGDRGRVHSLWYCDAFEAGRFGWAELGFVVTKEDGTLFPGEGIAPTARAPGPRVAAALAGRGGTLKLGYPLVDLSGAQARREFAERWVGWFADAALEDFRRGMLSPIDPELGGWRKA